MATANTKRRLVTSIHNLSPEQLAEVKALYPLGFNEVMQRIDKPDGTFFYVGYLLSTQDRRKDRRRSGGR